MTNVIRFPRACPKCGALAAMPSKAGTLTGRRTQVDLKCERCRHEWPLEMMPPVLIVTPERESDDQLSAEPPRTTPRTGSRERRGRGGPKRPRQRMRVGVRGLLTSSDRTHTIAVLYSLDAGGGAGRLRPMDPNSAWPRWLTTAKRVWLTGDDGPPLRARIAVVKAPAVAGDDGDHFAEFVLQK